ncbi:MAG: hypothetical protein AMJ88_13635 [Anaerolineae bacterium SM23_ 63]|nr:MAG: hypothetical protein AMJ88_13635 [Anaerolineae bacterium SM23_ 63]
MSLSLFSPLIPLPGSPDTSSSEVKTWKRCKGKWLLKYVLRRRRVSKSRALNFGSLTHSVLANYYGSRVGGQDGTTLSPLERLKKGFKVACEEEKPDRELVRDVFKILLNYIKFWKEDFDLFLPEMDFERVPVFDYKFAGFIHGRFDGALTSKDKIWVVDHKTGKQFKPKTYELDPQLDLYSVAGAKLFGKEFGGVIINYIRSKVAKSGVNFVRTEVVRSPSELTLIEHNLARTLRAMGSTLPVNIEFNYTHTCTWDCEFLSMCRRLRAGQTVGRFLEESYVLREDLEDESEEVTNG